MCFWKMTENEKNKPANQYIEMEGIPSLECEICHQAVDEGARCPRVLGCGHSLCTACIAALIQITSLTCPCCRKVFQVASVEQLPVNFGMTKILRALKDCRDGILTNNNAIGSVGSSEVSAKQLYNGNCDLHNSPIEFRCLTCELWMCDICVDKVHENGPDCQVIESVEALSRMKEEHVEESKGLLAATEADLGRVAAICARVTSLQAVLERQQKKLQSVLEEGGRVRDAVFSAHTVLYLTTTPQEVHEAIQAAMACEGAMQIWASRMHKKIPDLTTLTILATVVEVFAVA
ncbi:unnamed protein product, partial [Meganyctiphanes norvegica]